MLAISSGWAHRGELPTGHEVYLATVGSKRGPEAAALMRVPHNVILTHASNEAVQVLARIWAGLASRFPESMRLVRRPRSSPRRGAVREV
jgi:hypothetical protein